MPQKIKDNLVNYSIYLILAFILVSSILSFWNRYVTYDSKKNIDKSQRVNQLINSIEFEIISELQRGANTYVLTKDKEGLLPYQQAKQKIDTVFYELENHFKGQQYETNGILKLKNTIDEYDAFLQKMISSAGADSAAPISTFLIVREHKQVYQQFKAFSGEVLKFESEKQFLAQNDYYWSITDNSIIQIILILLSVPILIITLNKLRSEVKNRLLLISELENNNRKYLFDDGNETVIAAKDVVEKSISHLRKAFLFVDEISKRNYNVVENFLIGQDRERNKSTLMGALISMGEQLHKVDEEDKRRSWIAEGLNEFAEIIRKNQNDLSVFADKATSFLTKYTASQQGSLFIYQDNHGEEYLELTASYAFDKKKWIEKRIRIGEGLIGQAYLEKKHSLLSNLPKGYTAITSGLGDATPTYLIIIPMQYNERVEAVFEIAGFKKYEQHEISFLEKAGEYMAAALQNSKNTKFNEDLIKQHQEQSEILKAQEEELRQTIEEMQASQEGMKLNSL